MKCSAQGFGLLEVVVALLLVMITLSSAQFLVNWGMQQQILLIQSLADDTKGLEIVTTHIP